MGGSGAASHARYPQRMAPAKKVAAEPSATVIRARHASDFDIGKIQPTGRGTMDAT
jgi:hypothetical protein